MHTRSPTFIDKLATTIPVENQHWNTASENLFEAIHNNSSFRMLFSRDSPRYRIYHHSWKLTLSPACSGHEVYIQTYPTKAPTSFMRLEWNPHKSSMAASQEIFDFFRPLIPDFHLAFNQARITRADVTFDVRRAHPNMFYTYTQSARTKIEHYDNGYYLGQPKSKRHLLVYNKTQGELIPTARFEFFISNLGSASEILETPNRLLGYGIASRYKAMTAASTAEWMQFILRCQRTDVQTAFRSYERRETRARLRQILVSRCTPRWFDSAAIWHEGMNVLREAMAIIV